LARGVYLTPSLIAEAESMTETIVAERAEPTGVLGWLLLPLVQLIANPIFGAVSVVKEWIKGMPHLPSAVLMEHRIYALAGLAPVVVAVVAFVFGLFCLWQFLELKRRTPRLMIGWYVLNAFSSLLTLIYIQVAPRGFLDSIEPPWPVGQSLLLMAIPIVFNAIMIAYFLKSQRVRNTFVQ
jgi:hypothetical protein